jgi:hypothetical protein
VGPTDHGDVRHPWKLTENRLDIVGPHLLAAGDDDVVGPAVHPQQAVGPDLADVTRAHPPVAVLGIVLAVLGAVAPQGRGGAELEEAPLAGPDLDTGKRPPVVDDAAHGLGEPVGGDGVGWPVVGDAHPTEHDQPEGGGVDAVEHGRHQGGEGGPGPGDGRRVEGGVDHERRAGPKRPVHHAQPGGVGHGRAAQPGVAFRIDADGPTRHAGGVVQRVLGQDHALRCRRGPAGGQDDGVPFGRGLASRHRPPPVLVPDLGGPDPGQDGVPHGRRVAEVDGEGGGSLVPQPPQHLDERRPRQRDCDQGGHRG